MVDYWLRGAPSEGGRTWQGKEKCRRESSSEHTLNSAGTRDASPMPVSNIRRGLKHSVGAIQAARWTVGLWRCESAACSKPHTV
jgi:hypothetical protein